MFKEKSHRDHRTHKWWQICFTLVFDDFGVKYQGKEHENHFISVLKEHYEIAEDWEGEIYIGLTFDWDYKGKKIPPIHTRVRINSNAVFTSQNTNKTRRSTVPAYTTKLWCMVSVHRTRI